MFCQKLWWSLAPFKTYLKCRFICNVTTNLRHFVQSGLFKRRSCLRFGYQCHIQTFKHACQFSWWSNLWMLILFTFFFIGVFLLYNRIYWIASDKNINAQIRLNAYCLYLLLYFNRFTFPLNDLIDSLQIVVSLNALFWLRMAVIDKMKHL